MTTYRCPKCAQTVATPVTPTEPPVCHGRGPQPHPRPAVMVADKENNGD